MHTRRNNPWVRYDIPLVCQCHCVSHHCVIINRIRTSCVYSYGENSCERRANEIMKGKGKSRSSCIKIPFNLNELANFRSQELWYRFVVDFLNLTRNWCKIVTCQLAIVTGRVLQLYPQMISRWFDEVLGKNGNLIRHVPVCLLYI